MNKQAAEIEKLKQENAALAKIIHKDNKLIPALDLSVKSFLLTAAQNDDPQSRISDTQRLITELDLVSRERAGVVKSYEMTHRKLPSTGVTRIDSLLSYMQKKATDAGTDFDLSLWSGVKAEIGQVISEEDAATLLADLIENAIIATTYSSHEKRVLVGLDTLNGCFCISVSDSGIPFSDEVLENWGVKPVTTHADSGGSGIGLMTAHEICSRYHASFTIEEFEPDMMYAKRISICFDQAEQFTLISKQRAISHSPLRYP